MTRFAELNITSSDIGAAVAEAVLHDIRINSLSLDGFPEIRITRASQDMFKVNLSFKGYSQGFEISNFEATAAVKKMKSKSGHDPKILDRVQDALAHLEGMVNKPR